MNHTDILGGIAGTLTTLAFLPQVIRIWKTKSTQDISLGMFVVLCTGIFLWVLYGIFLHAIPVILSNVVTLILALIILGFKLKYG